MIIKRRLKLKYKSIEQLWTKEKKILTSISISTDVFVGLVSVFVFSFVLVFTVFSVFFLSFFFEST